MGHRRILVTGSGGIGGVNFIRALRLAEKQVNEKLFIIGTEHNPYHMNFSDLDTIFRTPKHNDPEFLPAILELCTKYSIEFLHPHPSSEARVIAENVHMFEQKGIRTYLPSPQAIMPDKLYIHKVLKEKNVPTPKTVAVESIEDVDRAFELLREPVWVRAVRGAGGRLSLCASTSEEAKLWIRLNSLQGRARVNEFIIQEYLPGRDIAFDSLWYEGKLIASYARERLEYPFKHISLTGITGTPTVARTIIDERVNYVGSSAVKALDPMPHGFYSADIKEDADGNPVVTEVDGKWHTAAPLWGYAFAKVFRRPALNLAYLYLKLGYGEEPPEIPGEDVFPPDYYLIRQLDSGVLLLHEDRVWRIV